MNLFNLLSSKFKSAIRKARKTLRQNQFKGDKVFCEICKSSFSEFAPHGLNKRPNARCLNCDSLERHRLFWKYLKEKTNFFDGSRKRVLHFAPEKMFYNKFSNLDSIEYIPCDLFPERYHFKGKVPVHKVDITRIPFDDHYFDVIICNHVLEHVPDDAQAMRELNRVLKAGGWGIFQVPIDYQREITYEDFSITTPEERQKAFGQHDHVRWYGQDYPKRLKAAGHNVVADPFVKTFTDEEIFKFGFDPNELIYFCKR